MISVRRKLIGVEVCVGCIVVGGCARERVAGGMVVVFSSERKERTRGRGIEAHMYRPSRIQ